MIKQTLRFVGLIALSVCIAVIVILLLAGPAESSALGRLNAMGALARVKVQETVSSAGAAITSRVGYTNIGVIDWDQGVVRATGYGVAPSHAESEVQGMQLALDAAQMDAQRSLAATLAGVKLKSERVTSDRAVASSRIEESVKARLLGAQIVEVRTLENGAVEVDMEVKIAPQAG